MARHPRRTARVVAAIVATIAFGLMPAAAHAGTPNYAWQVFRATNLSRLDHGLHRLRLDKGASALATKHSVAMARRNELFHTTDPGVYLSGVGRWSRWGENIGWTTGSVRDLQRAFMHSSVHRVHILDRRFRHVAVGAVRDGHKLWVTVFFYG